MREDDPLVRLGLVDPATGKALATADWQPADEPAPPPQRQQAQPAASGWGDNGQSMQAAQQYYQSKTGEVQTAAAAAYDRLVANKLDPQISEVLVRATAQAALSEVTRQAEHIALLPDVSQKVATDIARRFSTPGAEIAPTELASVGSPEQMMVRAQALQQERRNNRTAGRAAARQDRVEGGAPRGAEGADPYERLTSTEHIKLGLARGE
jgi:hypothetical protein